MNKKSLNILVVDDDKNFTFTLCEILRSEGYQCKSANTVKEAREILINGNFDCILSDVKMPEQTGTDLYKYVKKINPHLPFILMTAYTSSEVIEEALNSGVLAALPKPINIRSVLDFLAKLNQGMLVAVVCESKEACEKLVGYLTFKDIVINSYQTIQQMINAEREDYTLVFIDAQQHCEHYSNEVTQLIDFLPKKTIVIICDYKNGLKKGSKSALPEIINLIVLKKDQTRFTKIDKILEREFKKFAKQSIQ